jgi:hypothetical protein
MLNARDDEKLGSRDRGRLCIIAASIFFMGTVCAAPVNTVPQAGEWRAHDLVVAFHHLPKRYSCDDLQSKVTDVLRTMGARPESVFPYRCEQALGSRARSPEVHLQFSFPEVANRSVAETGMSVVRTTVELRPGHPSTLTDADCVLLRQLKETLLPAIPVRVLSYRMSCEAPGRAKPPFQLSVTAWAGVRPDSELASVNASSSAPQAEHR